ncbi:hypothetical protein FACS189413_19550 [Bacteroidia bacterium]|nr:hypothetical protein FACS189413_19550 [Bacteroidia bacterium]
MATIKNKKHCSLKFVFLFLFILSKHVVYSQSEYQTQMNDIFEIPSNKVTTGILINRSPDIIDMQNFFTKNNTNRILIHLKYTIL